MAGRGGKREGAGRRPKVALGGATQAIAVEVLNRLDELKIPGVKTKADYALHLMRNDKKAAYDLFVDMLNRSDGKPAQSVIAQGSIEVLVREIPGGDNTAAETGAAEKIM